ncbi:protein translocase subunit SecF [Pseudovibrio sp. Ad37]|uniref:protein translocase subunit SecF n=1 Tax=Pseudovibrio sp. Ad37 TaxID=989422 RepID=UPI0007AE3C4F|nr:protein translocase subunit SecF [Pseudovibrio sp. Ad37]KZL22884.1 Protein-export membrane protein SecF [Pseudovibrio sp. Ad37]
MKLLRLVPEQTNFRFMHWRVLSFPFSGITAVLSVVLFLAIGLNYGIDFKGGTLIELQSTSGPANLSEIRRTLGGLDLGDVQVQEFGSPTEVLIRIESQGEGESAQQDVVESVRGAFTDGYEFRRTEVVGPRVSGELAYAGTLAVGSALLMIMFYIWFRFEWQFAVGAIITTFNDILLTVGLFAVLQLDFTLSSIAAVLTIIGYSLNDTVVVYDRIRENLRRYKRLSLEELLDKSINETLSRTTMTSVTTLLALFALYFLGGEVIQSFVLAMIFGIVIGTYSSIFLASPLLMLMKLRTSVFDKKDDETSPAKSA